MASLPISDLDMLRRRIRALERPTAQHGRVLPFGVAEMDTYLPDGGLAQSTLHEIGGGGPDEVPAACAASFAAGILARLPHSVLWCSTGSDVFAPGLACAGLAPDRVIHVRPPDEAGVLLAMEEALRHPGLSAVLGELTRLPMTASRRLVLASEKSGVMALALRRRVEGRAADMGITASATRWRIAPLPSPALPVPGPGIAQVLGPARWEVALTRCRNAAPQTWIMEACDAQGRLSVPAELANRPVEPVWRVA